MLHGARSSPHDNPTERVWGTLKAWLANNPTLTIQGRVRTEYDEPAGTNSSLAQPNR